ncbi:unnamed protein product [Brassica oleracea var. botrytis]|uniref:(rape) hypothetical protein n=1 Tax=Brassica napus TaxID=3708 RepID=A0A816N809_BRANA|nr:unnamed protein product [Brassica napus]
MHVAELPGSGSGGDPILLFIQGFPELWYTWWHQMTAFSFYYRKKTPSGAATCTRAPETRGGRVSPKQDVKHRCR